MWLEIKTQAIDPYIHHLRTDEPFDMASFRKLTFLCYESVPIILACLHALPMLETL